MKNLLNGFYKPTPVFWRKLGDALLASGVFISGISIYQEFKWFAICSVILSVLGKFLTNFFSDNHSPLD